MPDARKESGWVRNVIDLLHARPDEGVSLADVAAATGRNPAHVARSFRHSVGCSMTEYLHLVRVSRARWMLRTTRLTLSQIAMACGFYDQAHFTRIFSRIMGVSPLRYRRQVSLDVPRAL
jgi:transcriptional regulator GlxA family with amidase domain